MEGLTVHLLADRPELIDSVADLRWREWGRPADRPDWLAITEREAGRDALPVTLVAVGRATCAVGAVGLGAVDAAVTDPGDRTPWVLGMIVRPDRRGSGAGRMLLSAVERMAARRGHTQMWVATGDRAVGFYAACGWRRSAREINTAGQVDNILRKLL